LKKIVIMLVVLLFIISTSSSAYARTWSNHHHNDNNNNNNTNNNNNNLNQTVASFTATPTSGNTPLTVTFTDTSTGSPTYWSWNFGDGGTSASQNPTHTYTQTGTYTITLTATNSAGSNTATKSSSISVTNSGSSPVASFTAAPTSGNTPLTVTFTDTSIGSPTSWSWNFGDGGTSTSQNTTHTYTQSGTYTPSLTVSNAYGSNTFVSSTPIAVSSAPDPAIETDFSSNVTSGKVPLKVQFNDLSTGYPTTWNWNFGDGAIVSGKNSSIKNPTHTYSAVGVYTVTLKVSSATSFGSITKKNYITVGNGLQAAFTTNPSQGIAPLTVQFNDTSIGTPTEWLWDFGDGNSSTLNNPVHIYTQTGNYIVKLIVSNNIDSNTTVISSAVNVSSVNIPVADFNSNVTSGKVPLNVQFNDLSTGNPTVWNWDFGDEASSTTKDPMHIYLAAGVYNVTLRVSNSAGWGNITKKDYITVGNGLQAAFTTNPSQGVAPLTVQFNDTSIGTPTEWLWDFGDGNTSTLYNPVHIYTQAGSYTVKLTVTNDTDSNTVTKSDFIVVSTPTAPVAAFTTSPISGYAPLTVTFTDTSTGSPSSWSWNFGDGSPLNITQSPIHVFTKKGNFNVILIVSNNNGTSSKSAQITVETMPGTTFWNLLPHEQNHQRPYSMTVYNVPNFFGFKQNKGHYFYVSDFFSNRYSSWNTYRNSNVPFAFDIPANSINISSLYVGASHQKSNQEYVEILNNGTDSVNLKGWKITDKDSKHVYVFPSYTLKAKSTVTLRSGHGINTATALYWNKYSFIWNNNGDTAHLYNAKGKLVSSKKG
jgi:PKD repeat protein